MQGVVGIVIAPCYGVPARDFGAIQARQPAACTCPT